MACQRWISSAVWFFILNCHLLWLNWLLWRNYVVHFDIVPYPSMYHIYIQFIKITSSNGNIFRVTCLCEEFIGLRWIPPHKGQWLGALMFSLILARINAWVNNREAGDLRCHRAHYDVILTRKESFLLTTHLTPHLRPSLLWMWILSQISTIVLYSCYELLEMMFFNHQIPMIYWI